MPLASMPICAKLLEVVASRSGQHNNASRLRRIVLIFGFLVVSKIKLFTGIYYSTAKANIIPDMQAIFFENSGKLALDVEVNLVIVRIDFYPCWFFEIG